MALSRARHDFSEDDRALLSVLRGPLAALLLRARRRRQAADGLSCGALASLTGREAEILRLVAAGHTNTAIAHRLKVTPRTIAKHLEHIYRKIEVSYRKLEVSSRAAAVARITVPTGPANRDQPGEDQSPPGQEPAQRATRSRRMQLNSP